MTKSRWQRFVCRGGSAYAERTNWLSPQDSPGWWSIWSLLACFLLFVAADLSVGSSTTADGRSALAIALTAVIGLVAAGALVTATIGVVKNRERSLVVFVVMALGLYQVFGTVVALLGLPK